jgi:hypothetical protein
MIRPLVKIVGIVCIAQNKYAPFSKNRREIFTIQKMNWSAAISFEKTFKKATNYNSKKIRPIDCANRNINAASSRVNEFLLESLFSTILVYQGGNNEKRDA